MKNLLILATVLVAPVTFAGGAGNMDWYDSLSKARSTSAPTMAVSSLEYSSENPTNSLSKFTDCFKGSGDANGLIEFEECFGETQREQFQSGEDLDREDVRQSKAQDKAARLRFLYR